MRAEEASLSGRQLPTVGNRRIGFSDKPPASGEARIVATWICIMCHVCNNDFARPQLPAVPPLSSVVSRQLAKMLASRTLTSSARVATKTSQVRVHACNCLTTPRSTAVLQAFRHYASAAPTAAFAGQKGANVSPSSRLKRRPKQRDGPTAGKIHGHFDSWRR